MRRALLVVPLAGCVILPRSLEPPPNDQTTVALLTGTLGACTRRTSCETPCVLV